MRSSTTNNDRFRQLEKEFHQLTTEERKVRWLMAAIALLEADDVTTTSLVLPYIETNAQLFDTIIFPMMEEQLELSVIALRFLALALALACRCEVSNLHACMCSRAEERIPILIALGKTDDPMLMPHLMIVFNALANGPSASNFANTFAIFGDLDCLRLTLKLLKVADRRSTGMSLLSVLLETKEGIRLCQRASGDIDNAVIGTPLEREWKLKHKL